MKHYEDYHREHSKNNKPYIFITWAFETDNGIKEVPDSPEYMLRIKSALTPYPIEEQKLFLEDMKKAWADFGYTTVYG